MKYEEEKQGVFMEKNNKETIKEETKKQTEPKENLEARAEADTAEEANLEENEEVEIASEEDTEEVGKIKAQIFGIEVRMQEIDAILERYEDDYFQKQQSQPEEPVKEDEKISALKAEYKELAKARKELLKGNKKSIWDNFPVWMGFYAVFQIIFSFYLIMTQLSTYFASWFYALFTSPTEFWFYFALFVIPFLSLLASLIILLCTKNKVHKKIFLFVYLIQGIETLMSVGMLMYAILS